MGWSYSDDPGHSLKDQVRYLVGDTDPTDQLASDEEITFVLGISGDNAYKAAADVADNIAASMAKKMDRTVGSLSASYTQRYTQYTELAVRLRRQSKSKAPGVVVLTQESVEPIFRKGMHDNESRPPYDEEVS